MNKITFYKDEHGNEPVADYMRELARKNGKNSRVNLEKIQDYIELLAREGTRIGKPVVKHMEGKIWELRPLKNRIFFVASVDDGFVLLHHFIKKSKKTPPKELEKARRELADLLERGEDNE